MDVVRLIFEGLRSGDFFWSRPLVQTLEPDGPLRSVRWVERCLHRMVDLAELRLRTGSIHDKIAGASAMVAAPSKAAVSEAVKRAGLTGDPAVDAIAILYWAYWEASHRDNASNQFVVTQESVFRRMSAFWAGDDWLAVTELAVEEYERALDEAYAADEPDHCEDAQPDDAPGPAG